MTIQLGFGPTDLEPDVQNLVRSIERIRFSQPFIPSEVRDEVTAIMRYRKMVEPEESWYKQPPAGKKRALSELEKPLDISSVSRIIAEHSMHEAAWKSELHHPLLNLALNDADNIRRDEENLRLGK